MDDTIWHPGGAKNISPTEGKLKEARVKYAEDLWKESTNVPVRGMSGNHTVTMEGLLSANSTSIYEDQVIPRIGRSPVRAIYRPWPHIVNTKRKHPKNRPYIHFPVHRHG